MIKPCPFCGYIQLRVETLLILRWKAFRVVCDGCLAVGPQADEEKEAIFAWNLAKERTDTYKTIMSRVEKKLSEEGE